ncbi:MAG: type II secretion system F family protein [Caulobacteraceae bacterium]
MAVFRYRAASAAGEMKAGVLEGASRDEVLARLRGLGLMPIEAQEASARETAAPKLKANGAARQAATYAIGELATLLGAGLTLDRALAVCTENVTNPAVKAAFIEMHRKVKEGAPLSRAMAENKALFAPMASAMAESGEANGKLHVALARLSETLERAEALRQTLISAMIYPALLLTVAVAVILMMMLVVVPQFQDLFDQAGGKLPFMSLAVMAVSKAIRAYGLAALLVLVLFGVGLRFWLKRPGVAVAADRLVLRAPLIGKIVRDAETARFARVLGSLVEGGVPLPQALAIAQRSLANQHMRAAVARVSAGLKEGGGLTRPLAATGLFPPVALSFLRTGEETAQLGPMLDRLSDLLDRSVRTAVQRSVTILTPAITVMMGGMVATVIAAIMSAILGFNDLALAP